jgi:hypothetical protein
MNVTITDEMIEAGARAMAKKYYTDHEPLNPLNETIERMWKSFASEAKVCLEAAMAQAPAPTPATWQRRQKYALRCPTVDADPWKECGYKEATDMFEHQPGYEYRPLYSSPPPASEAVQKETKILNDLE